MMLVGRQQLIDRSSNKHNLSNATYKILMLNSGLHMLTVVVIFLINEEVKWVIRVRVVKKTL